MAELHKITKSAAEFEHPADKEHKDEPCRDCEYFQKIAPLHCSKVTGIIMPGDHCSLFHHK